jgi:hypothetical protein
MSPDQIREAFERGKALDPDTSMSDDAVYAMHEQQRILEEEETELPVPQTKPLPYRPESLPTTSMNETRGQVILEGLTSTKDYHQNVDTPETQDKRREEQFDAVAKRKEDELVTEGAGALMEALSSAKISMKQRTFHSEKTKRRNGWRFKMAFNERILLLQT